MNVEDGKNSLNASATGVPIAMSSLLNFRYKHQKDVQFVVAAVRVVDSYYVER